MWNGWVPVWFIESLALSLGSKGRVLGEFWNNLLRRESAISYFLKNLPVFGRKVLIIYKCYMICGGISWECLMLWDAQLLFLNTFWSVKSVKKYKICQMRSTSIVYTTKSYSSLAIPSLLILKPCSNLSK